MNIRLLCILAFIFSSYAGAQQCTTSVLVNAFDARTKTTLHGLRASDFAASIGREATTVDSVRPVFRNRVLVLLDVSRYKNDSSRNALLQSTVDDLEESPAGMPVMFGAFAERAVFTANFSSDPESLAASVKLTVPRASSLGGKSNLTNALHQALKKFGQHRPGDTILLVSNGDGRLGRSLARDFARSGARLQLLMNAPDTSDGHSFSLFAAFAAADQINPNLIKLANSTGGVLMGFMNSEWYDAAASGYLLEVRESQSRKPQSWRLQVRNYDDEFGVESVLFYPLQLPACSVPLIASTRPHGES